MFARQIKETAIGTHAPLVFANLTHGYLEATLFIKFSRDVVGFFWKIFLDF